MGTFEQSGYFKLESAGAAVGGAKLPRRYPEVG